MNTVLLVLLILVGAIMLIRLGIALMVITGVIKQLNG